MIEITFKNYITVCRLKVMNILPRDLEIKTIEDFYLPICFPLYQEQFFYRKNGEIQTKTIVSGLDLEKKFRLVTGENQYIHRNMAHTTPLEAWEQYFDQKEETMLQDEFMLYGITNEQLLKAYHMEIPTMPKIINPATVKQRMVISEMVASGRYKETIKQSEWEQLTKEKASSIISSIPVPVNKDKISNKVEIIINLMKKLDANEMKILSSELKNIFKKGKTDGNS